MFECIANTESARRNRLEFTSVRHDERAAYESKKIEDKSPKLETQIAIAEIPKVSQHRTAAPSVPAASTLQPKPIVLPGTSSDATVESKSETPIVKRSKPKTELEMKIIQTQDEHPSKKKDIFKAIFDSSDESGASDNDDDDQPHTAGIRSDVLATLTKPSAASTVTSMYSQLPDEAFRPKSAREINILRNTSPPRGIFSGLLKKPDAPIKRESDKTDAKPAENDAPDTPDTYGPSLPPPTFSSRPTNATSSLNGNAASSSTKYPVTSISLSKHSDVKVTYEEKWIERSSEKEKKSKKEKKHKKDRDRKEHKAKKQKKEKHKKKKR